MLDDQLEPVSSRITIGDGVYFQLRNALITGRFNPGQALPVSALASSFKTSPMPVREALRRLGAENALEIAPNGSACVPKVSVKRLDDLCRARVELEGLATELAAVRLKPAIISTLETMVLEHEASSASDNVFDLLLKNRDFHFAVYRASGSEVLVQLIDTLWLRYGPYMRMLSSYMAPRLGTGMHGSFFKLHHAVVEAFRTGDGPAARQLMIRDITGLQPLLRELCETAMYPIPEIHQE